MENNKEIKHRIVETYAEDMAKILEDDKQGLIKKIIQGEEQHEKEKQNLSPESKKNQLFMLVGSILILVSLATVFYFLLNRSVPTVPVEKQFSPLIFNDKTVFPEVKDLKKDEIAQTVLNEVNKTEVKLGGVEGIYLTANKKLLGLRDFLALIKSSLVLAEKTLVSDNFLMGVVNTGGRLAPASGGGDFFILIKVRASADIFDSLRAWEPKMFLDLHGFFGISISPETKYLLTKSFEDGIINNKNARVLLDANDKVVMMYIFADDNSVIITNTTLAAQEIMLRLAASQVKK